MKKKSPDEFENFNNVMDGLLAVPRKELLEKLEEERQNKAKRKERKAISSPSSRVASSSKRREV